MAARYTEAHDDMLGVMRSSLTGATVWSTEPITGTGTPGFIGGALRNNSGDYFQVNIQVPHRRKLNSILDSIHIHYILQAASNLNDTIVWSGNYCWVQPGDAVPADASWTAFSGAGLTQSLGAAKPVRYYGIHGIQSGITCPAAPNEGYGGMLLIRLTRGNGSYAGNLFILDCDAHTIVDRKGSVNETSD